MSDSADPICFYCSQVFEISGQLNRTPDGRPCPICSDRLMESLPPLMPGGSTEAGEAPGTPEVEAESETDGDLERAPVHFRVVEDRPEPA